MNHASESVALLSTLQGVRAMQRSGARENDARIRSRQKVAVLKQIVMSRIKPGIYKEFGGWKNIICTQDGIQTHHQMHKTEIREGGNDKVLQNSGDITVISEAFCPTVGPDVFSRRRRKNV